MERPDPPQSDGITRRGLITSAAGAVLAARGARADAAPLEVAYLRWTERRPTISLLDKPAADDGLAGAQLAIRDNNTTGRFLGQQFALIDAPVREGDDPVDVFGKAVTEGTALLLTDVPMQQLLAVAGAANAKGATLFNVAAPDDALRQESCRGNVIHVAPSRAMLADALAQYLAWKKWTCWVLAYGSHPEDGLLADAYRRSAKRFGARIVKDLPYKDTGGARQTRLRGRTNAAADACFHSGAARLRRPGDRRRERGIRRLLAISDVGCATCRRISRLASCVLESQQ